jgi:hypothetical protein
VVAQGSNRNASAKPGSVQTAARPRHEAETLAYSMIGVVANLMAPGEWAAATA